MIQTITTKQAARILSCSAYVVRELCQAGRLPAVKLKKSVHSHWRISLKDLEEWIRCEKAKQQAGKR